MSELLGPIHIWLYNKIKFQNELAETIYEDMKKLGFCNEELEQMDNICGRLENGELEDIIDENDIHGWLQERVKIVEKRLAFLVTAVIKEHPERINNINEAVYKFSKKNEVTDSVTPYEAYGILDKRLLNGMPCDHVNEILEESEACIIWTHTIDIHAPYWNDVNGDVKNYHDIMACLTAGMFENSTVKFERTANHSYKLSKGEKNGGH